MGFKTIYKVRNWTQYNRSLVGRGNLTIWMEEQTLSNWYGKKTGLRGRPEFYSDQCITMALVLRSLFQLPLRSTQGFLEGLLKMLRLDLKVPNYSRLSRRAKKLSVEFRIPKSENKKFTDLVIDSTGLKLYGEGEWKMRTHGKQKRRTWRKMHVAVDPASFHCVAMELTHANVHDDTVMPALLSGLKNIRIVHGDGAYISKPCFDAIVASGARAKIPIRSGTCIVEDKKKPSPGLLERNRLIREIRKAGGRPDWKKSSRYHQRSLVETQMFRFKKILGGTLAARTAENQLTEAKIKTLVLNKMTSLGMPDSYRFA